MSFLSTQVLGSAGPLQHSPTPTPTFHPLPCLRLWTLKDGALAWGWRPAPLPHQLSFSGPQD